MPYDSNYYAGGDALDLGKKTPAKKKKKSTTKKSYTPTKSQNQYTPDYYAGGDKLPDTPQRSSSTTGSSKTPTATSNTGSVAQKTQGGAVASKPAYVKGMGDYGQTKPTGGSSYAPKQANLPSGKEKPALTPVAGLNDVAKILPTTPQQQLNTPAYVQNMGTYPQGSFQTLPGTGEQPQVQTLPGTGESAQVQTMEATPTQTSRRTTTSSDEGNQTPTDTGANNPPVDTGQDQMQTSIVQTGNVVDSVTSTVREFRNMSDEHAAASTAYLGSMLEQLGQLEANILNQIRGQMNGDDPALQAAIGLIREEADRLYKESLEDLNARGIVQSGVYAEMQDRLNKGTMTQIQQVVGQRFGDLQNQLNQAVMSLAQTRMSIMSQGLNALNQSQIADRNTLANMNMQGIGYGLQQRGQDMQNQQFNLSQTFQAQQNALNRDFQATQNQATRDQQWDIFQQQDATSRYGTDRSYDLANKNYQLGQDQFNYTKETRDQERLTQDMAYARQELSGNITSILGASKNLAADKENIKSSIRASGLHPSAQEWLIQQIDTQYPDVQQTDPTRRPRTGYTPSGSSSWSGSGGYTPTNVK